jgi:uncharacterized protein YjaG (DUF416 family)
MRARLGFLGMGEICTRFGCRPIWTPLPGQPMQTAQLKTIDHYETALDEAVRAWSPAQRVALAAAMAERWLPIYEAFAAAEEWGDPAALRRTLDAVWGHVLGRMMTPADRARHAKLLDDCTPHMDDFDAPEALAACVVLREALDCCNGADNAVGAVRAALSGFEAALPDWAFDPDEQPRLWKHTAVRKELRKQLKVVEEIGGLANLDERAVGSLRERLRGKELVGEKSPTSAAPTQPPGLTNQQAFEQYRRMVEADLRNQRPVDMPGVSGALLRFGVWAGRYSRRRQTLDGSYGRLADVAGQRAVIARLRARDAIETERPEWAPADRMIIELAFSNPASVHDIRSPYDPHGFGPSVRRLWLEGKRAGGSVADAWEAVLAWARHRPAAWAAEDKRKKKGQAHATPALSALLARDVTWADAGDVECPWAAHVDEARWRVRVNDFPDDYMYTLFVADAEVGSFHDWPETWHRG